MAHISSHPHPNWDELVRTLRGLDSAVVTTHVNPDGDAVGCAVVLTDALRSTGCDVRAVMTSEVPPVYASLDPEGVIERYDPAMHDELIESRALIVVDTSSEERLARMKEIARKAPRRYVLDHHKEDGTEFDLAVIDPDAPACAELLLRLLDDLPVPVETRWARALYVAVMTDTGGFRFSNTNARAHRVAARLLDEFPSLDASEAYSQFYESYSPARMRLLGKALAGLRIECDGQLGYMTVTRAEINEEDVPLHEMEGVVDYARTVAGVLLALLFVEPRDGITKVSVRSREPVDAAEFAATFGGGGHARAAGIRLKVPFLEGLEAVLQAARALFRHFDVTA
jgi:phosphoesterase RecJ-like protein